MKKNTDDLLNEILAGLDRFEYISPEDIPNIDLYMDQVTTFIDRKMRAAARYPDDDKILTKTMINNYAKNDLLPPPMKKKYSRDHILMLIFIYYYKGILSIGDIQTLLKPLTDQYFRKPGEPLEEIYQEIFAIAHEQKKKLVDDVTEKYERARKSFADKEEEDREFLQLFAFIGELSFDVYLKKMMIEKLIDRMKGPKDVRKETKKEEKSK